jgi:hypothetical protein
MGSSHLLLVSCGQFVWCRTKHLGVSLAKAKHYLKNSALPWLG